MTESELQRIRTHFRILDELSRGAGIDPLDVAAVHRRLALTAAAAADTVAVPRDWPGACAGDGVG